MPFREFNTLAALVFALGMSSSVGALAAPVSSWNPSRDLMSITGYPTPSYSGNTVGAWSFLYGPLTSASPLNVFTSSPPNIAVWLTSIPYLSVALPLQSYTSPSAGGTVSLTKGLAFVHPGPTQPVIVKWTGKTTGALKVLARFSDIDPNCGDGVKWVVYKNSTVLGAGLIANGNNGDVFNTSLTVIPTDNLYFTVEPVNNNLCDSTALDVMITAGP